MVIMCCGPSCGLWLLLCVGALKNRGCTKNIQKTTVELAA
jgi:hypothetical protein